ncbi:hypothetical protein BDR06DRAFT_148758 [Suillus hirtellus]|nr:hypothetical protein BDR06DRAFT_148758 [Suillus hirtellus]
MRSSISTDTLGINNNNVNNNNVIQCTCSKWLQAPDQLVVLLSVRPGSSQSHWLLLRVQIPIAVTFSCQRHQAPTAPRTSAPIQTSSLPQNRIIQDPRRI